MQTNIIFAVLTIATMFYSVWMIRSQQRTIDRLNDRLMARDYREYVSLTQHDKPQERPLRRPMSWHDDPGIEIGEEQTV